MTREELERILEMTNWNRADTAAPAINAIWKNDYEQREKIRLLRDALSNVLNSFVQGRQVKDGIELIFLQQAEFILAKTEETHVKLRG